MRSLRVLTVLLVLLVLVPAGVLGWLGIRGTDRFLAEMRERIDQELVRARDAAQRLATEFASEEALDSDARVAAAADLLARRLPFERVGRALAEARSVLFVGAPTGPRSGAEFDRPWQFSRADLRIVDVSGHPVLPVPFDPDLAAKAHSDTDRLFDDLSREADTARFGRDDRDGALAIWKTAAARLSEPAWKARAEIEAARLVDPHPTRVGFSLGSIMSELISRYPESVLVAVGRPWVLLLLRAGEVRALQALDDDGRLAEIPLTEIERGFIRERLRPGDPPGPVDVMGGRALNRASLPGGLVLEVSRHWPSLRVGPAGLLIERWRARLPAVAEVSVATVSDRPPAVDRTGRMLVSLEIPRPGLAPVWATLTHRDEPRLLAEVAASRRWTTIGALSLVGVIGLGLLVGRFAVAREREARRQKDDFLANVSHELRTPLTSVCLHADLLSEPGLPESQRCAHAEVVRAEGARLTSLVDDLLDFAALARQSRRLEPEPVDLGAAAERAVAPFRVLAAREGAGLTLDLEPGELLGMADPHALGRILSNLVGNAWKHGRPSRDSFPGRLAVRVTIAGDRPTIDVVDDGPGIPPNERSGLFQRFQRGSAAGKTRGVGLGLALSRDLARAMGGDIVVVEDPARTVFRLTLPPVPPESPGGSIA